MLFVARRVSHDKLHISVNLGKNAESNTDGTQISKKLVNVNGLHLSAISTTVVKVITFSLSELHGVTTRSNSISTQPDISMFCVPNTGVPSSNSSQNVVSA